MVALTRAFADPTKVPTLVLIDMQQEYVAAPRLLAVPDAERPLANCRAALAHARRCGFPVAFVRWEGRSPLLNRATPFSGWIDGFTPTGIDLVFERRRPSCYSSARFAEVMELGGGSMVIAGFAGEAACLSTIIEAFHHGHTASYLADASASHDLNSIPASEVHRNVAEIARLYAEVLSTDAWIALTAPGDIQGRERWKLG